MSLQFLICPASLNVYPFGPSSLTVCPFGPFSPSPVIYVPPVWMFDPPASKYSFPHSHSSLDVCPSKTSSLSVFPSYPPCHTYIHVHAHIHTHACTNPEIIHHHPTHSKESEQSHIRFSLCQILIRGLLSLCPPSIHPVQPSKSCPGQYSETIHDNCFIFARSF